MHSTHSAAANKSTMDKLKCEDVLRLAALWTRAQPVVAGFVSSVVPNFHDAGDILQDVALVLGVKFHEYDGERSFTQWALGITRNKVLAYYRKQCREKQILDDYLIERIASSYEETGPHLGVIHEALRRCMNKVRERDRRLLEMWYADQREPAEIARLMGIAKSTIYVILHRVRNALKLCIRRQLAIMGEA